MVGALLVALSGLAFGCEDLDKELRWAQDEVLLEVNPRAARQALASAEKALGCGSPQKGSAIARMFLIEAATAVLEGDASGANDAFAAAHRVSPDTWIDALGGKMREQYDAAATATVAQGSVDLDPGDWDVWVDGAPVEMPTPVAAGLHVVQVHGDGEVVYGRVLWVGPGEEQTIDVVLPVREAAKEPVAAAVEPEPSSQSQGLALSVGLGAAASFGRPLSGVRVDGAELSEPGTKLTLPLEVGVVVPMGDLWIRPSIGLAPLLGGQFLWAGQEGAESSFVAGLADLSVGVDLGAVHLGGMAGIAFPGRIGLKALAGLPVGDTPLFAELRGGVNLATGGRIEPVVGLAVSARVP